MSAFTQKLATQLRAQSCFARRVTTAISSSAARVWRSADGACVIADSHEPFLAVSAAHDCFVIVRSPKSETYEGKPRVSGYVATGDHFMLEQPAPDAITALGSTSYELGFIGTKFLGAEFFLRPNEPAARVLRAGMVLSTTDDSEPEVSKNFIAATQRRLGALALVDQYAGPITSETMTKHPLDFSARVGRELEVDLLLSAEWYVGEGEEFAAASCYNIFLGCVFAQFAKRLAALGPGFGLPNLLDAGWRVLSTARATLHDPLFGFDIEQRLAESHTLLAAFAKDWTARAA